LTAILLIDIILVVWHNFLLFLTLSAALPARGLRTYMSHLTRGVLAAMVITTILLTDIGLIVWYNFLLFLTP
jgi:hypothetical protein